MDRIWGVADLAPLFGVFDRRIGEVWFDSERLLVKFLFTSEALSVQVHPDDAYAATHESSPGKTEMWYVLRAAEGSRLAVGFREPVTREQVRQAALDESIERLLAWHTPRAGDTFFTPARTVHSLGPGLVICEIQQRSDITYRLYDYGRGREIHLDKSLAVADLGPHPGVSFPELVEPGIERLASCSHFVTERWELTGPRFWPGGLLIVVEGQGTLAGRRAQAGEVWNVENGLEVSPEGRLTVLRTYAP